MQTLHQIKQCNKIHKSIAIIEIHLKHWLLHLDFYIENFFAQNSFIIIFRWLMQKKKKMLFLYSFDFENDYEFTLAKLKKSAIPINGNVMADARKFS